MIGVDVERHDATITVRITGEVDIAGCERLEPRLDEAIASAPDVLRLDLVGVTFLDSRGVAVLVSVRRDVDGTPTRLVIVGASRQALRALETMRLTGYFEFDPPIG